MQRFAPKSLPKDGISHEVVRRRRFTSLRHAKATDLYLNIREGCERLEALPLGPHDFLVSSRIM
jgi:hypothetical protein